MTGSPRSLRIYAALFCLEYQRLVRKLRQENISDIGIASELDVTVKELHFDPLQMDGIILRIYQFNDIREEVADGEEIRALMDIIVADNDLLRKIKAEG